MALKSPIHTGGKIDPKSNWGFYISHKGRFLFQNFAALYAAKHFVRLMIDGDSFTWITPTTIRTERGVTIRSEQPTGLEEVMEHEFTPEELNFRFASPYDRMYYAFPRDNNWGPPPPEDYQDEGLSTPTERKPKPKKEDKPKKKPRTPRPPKPTGLITVADIAQSLKIDPKHARLALRKAGTPKPDHGWAWSTDQVDAITKAIKDHLK